MRLTEDTRAQYRAKLLELAQLGQHLVFDAMTKAQMFERGLCGPFGKDSRLCICKHVRKYIKRA